MKSKASIAATTAGLTALMLAAPPIARAGIQDDWLVQQLQITDGYAPPASANFSARFDRSAAGQNVSKEDRAQSGWLTQQLQISDGYAPFDGSFARTNTAASEPSSTEQQGQSEWLTRQLQITDGYGLPPVARATDQPGTMTSAYQARGNTHN
jgi:hypothetical protein